MPDKCQRLESQLEAYVSGGLDSGAREEFERHAAGCGDCRAQVDGFARIDALVAAHFRQRLARARRPAPTRIRSLRLVAALGTLVAAAVAVSLGISMVTSDTGSNAAADEEIERAAIPAEPASPRTTPTVSADIDKVDEASDAELAKPDPVAEPAVSVLLDRAPAMLGTASSEARFYVQDAAGYFHTLEDFSGSVLVLAVVDQSASEITAFERAYERYGAGVGIRFLGVTAGGASLESARFPTMQNRESALLETRAGEFAIVAPDGTIHARGTLEEQELFATIESSLRQLAP
jgi:hypothetical protein